MTYGADLIRTSAPTLASGAPDHLFDDLGQAKNFAASNGNDTYVISNAASKINELASQGTDRVVSSLPNYTLPDNLEQLKLADRAITGNGNALDNFIRGNSANNILTGGDGDDILIGADGSDKIDGGKGIDYLVWEQPMDASTITKTATGYTMQSAQIKCEVTNVERVIFSSYDRQGAHALDEVGSQAYRLY